MKNGTDIGTTTTTRTLRVVGVTRFSRQGDREFTETLERQEEAIREWSDAKNFEVVAIFQERDLSGGLPLAKRTGLLPAVQMIEDDGADLLVGAYFDRLARDPEVKDEIVDRVEVHGKRVVALDVGDVSNATAASWMMGHLQQTIAKYFRLTTGERVLDSKRAAIAEGRPVIAHVPPGYRRTWIERKGVRRTGPLEIDPETGPIVREAFQRRARGATQKDVRAFLAENGIVRASVQSLLSSRIYLGEISVGDGKGGRIVNSSAHPALIPVALFDRVQRMRSPRGRQTKTNALLERMDLLVCGECLTRMGAHTNRYRLADGSESVYSAYYCLNSDCQKRGRIDRERAETLIRDETIAESHALNVREGRANVSLRIEEIESRIEELRAEETSTMESFRQARDKETANRILAEIASELVALEDEAETLKDLSRTTRRITTLRAWTRATLPERRDLLRTTFSRIVCHSGTLEFVAS